MLYKNWLITEKATSGLSSDFIGSIIWFLWAETILGGLFHLDVNFLRLFQKVKWFCREMLSSQVAFQCCSQPQCHMVECHFREERQNHNKNPVETFIITLARSPECLSVTIGMVMEWLYHRMGFKILIGSASGRCQSDVEALWLEPGIQNLYLRDGRRLTLDSKVMWFCQIGVGLLGLLETLTGKLSEALFSWCFARL